LRLSNASTSREFWFLGQVGDIDPGRHVQRRRWLTGGWTTAGLWVLTLVVRLALGAVANAVFGEPLNVNALWLGMGVTLVVQQYAIELRARGLGLRGQDAAKAPSGVHPGV
jgi:hypothetical protein